MYVVVSAQGSVYLWSTCKLEDMSAARLAVGEDPRMGWRVK
jgi:hypothetical protein